MTAMDLDAFDAVVLITTDAVKRFIQSQPRDLVCKEMIIQAYNVCRYPADQCS